MGWSGLASGSSLLRPDGRNVEAVSSVHKKNESYEVQRRLVGML